MFTREWTQYEPETAAVWTALESVLTPAQCDAFMFMGLAPGDPAIYLYKHRGGRRYLNVDAMGNCYQYVVSLSGEGQVIGGYYRPQDRADALAHALN